MDPPDLLGLSETDPESEVLRLTDRTNSQGKNVKRQFAYRHLNDDDSVGSFPIGSSSKSAVTPKRTIFTDSALIDLERNEVNGQVRLKPPTSSRSSRSAASVNGRTMDPRSNGPSSSAASSYSDSFSDSEWSGSQSYGVIPAEDTGSRYTNVPNYNGTADPVDATRYYSTVTNGNLDAPPNLQVQNAAFSKSCSTLNLLPRTTASGDASQARRSNVGRNENVVQSQWETAFRDNPRELLRRRDRAFDWLNDTIGSLGLDAPSATWPKVNPAAVNVSSAPFTYVGRSEPRKDSPQPIPIIPKPGEVSRSSSGGVPRLPPPPPTTTTNQQKNWPRSVSASAIATVDRFGVDGAAPPRRPSCPPNSNAPNPKPTLHSATSHLSLPGQSMGSSPIKGWTTTATSTMLMPTPTSHLRYAPTAPCMSDLYQVATELQARVKGATLTQCWDALYTAAGSTDVAEKTVKVDVLHGLGLATRDRCHRVLVAVDWNLERAGSVLLDDASSERPTTTGKVFF